MIRYERGSTTLIERIEPLWDKLRLHHVGEAKYFKYRFKLLSFEERCNTVMRHAGYGGRLIVDMAVDDTTDRDVGYCVTTINSEDMGEVESIYVESDYRGYGVGDQLMKRSLDWLEYQEAKSVQLSIIYGNDSVATFYERYGFKPLMMTMEQKR